MVSPGDEPTGALVRPYAVTGGRTRPKVDIAIEALVETTVKGRTSSRDGFSQGREQQYIVTLCDGRLQSLAEISPGVHVRFARTRYACGLQPSDGMVSIYEPTSIDGNDAVGTELLERVLSGLRKL